MRLIHLETLSTLDHPSPAVEAGKKAAVMTAATALLMARMSRKSTELQNLSKSSPEAKRLNEELESMKQTLKAIERNDDTNSSWDFDVTWIVVRKAIHMDTTKGWMTVKKPSAQPPDGHR